MNVHVFARIKKNTNEKMLWLRTFASTAIGLITNVVLFTLLAFIGIKSVEQIVQMILISLVIRIFTAFAEIGFLYLMKIIRPRIIVEK